MRRVRRRGAGRGRPCECGVVGVEILEVRRDFCFEKAQRQRHLLGDAHPREAARERDARCAAPFACTQTRFLAGAAAGVLWRGVPSAALSSHGASSFGCHEPKNGA